jgi:hypothetical protein
MGLRAKAERGGFSVIAEARRTEADIVVFPESSNGLTSFDPAEPDVRSDGARTLTRSKVITWARFGGRRARRARGGDISRDCRTFAVQQRPADRSGRPHGPAPSKGLRLRLRFSRMRLRRARLCNLRFNWNPRYQAELTKKHGKAFEMSHPTTKRRGGEPDVPAKSRRKAADAHERKLEQGLEETMAGSDSVSVTQPRRGGDKDSE